MFDFTAPATGIFSFAVLMTGFLTMDRPLALACIVLASSLTIFAGAMVGPALPLIADQFAAHRFATLYVPLVLTIPGLVIALTASFAGVVADRCGRTRLLAAGLVLYAVAGMSGLILESLEAIIVGRMFLGLAVACIMTGATALIVDYWQDGARVRAFGIQAAAVGFGGVAFPLFAGVLAQSGWRAPFAGYLVALPLIVVASLTLKDVPRAETRSAGTSARFPIAFALVIFVLAAVCMMAMYAIPLRIPFLLRKLGYDSPLLHAASLALPSFVAAIASLSAWRLQSRMSAPGIVAVTFGAITLGYLVVASTESLAAILLGLAISGIGFGLNTPNLMSWLQQGVPAAMRGRAAGGYTTAVFLGQFLATFLFALLARATNFAGTFAAVAAGSATVALIALLTFAGSRRHSAASLRAIT